MATPSVTVSRAEPTIGSPVDMTYRFAIPADAPPMTEDLWVFVHFLDSDDELMWTDDHAPPTPTRQWTRGSTVEYTRTMFIPKFPYVGDTRVRLGLFSPATGQRVVLNGQDEGQRSYEVARFNMRLESDNLFVIFKDGWHATEFAAEGAGREWQWSRKNAVLSFRNPKRDVRLYLQVDQPIPDAFPEPQHIELRIGDAVIDRFDMPGGAEDLRRIDIPAAQLGSGETVDVTVVADKTFVPALVPGLKSNDSRELGVRVFRAYVEPRGGAQ